MQITLAYLNALTKVMNNQQLFLKDTQSRGKVLQNKRSKILRKAGEKGRRKRCRKSALATRISLPERKDNFKRQNKKSGNRKSKTDGSR